MSSLSATTNSGQLTSVPKKAWGILFLVLFMSIAAPLNMFKAPGLAGTLMETFGLAPASFGWLMSIFTVMGIVLAFPAAGIMFKLGIKNTAVIALVSLIIGSIIGALSASYEVLLAGRFLEGVSMGLISVTAPAAISKWFPKHKRGLALGIWTPWVPIGSIIMLNLANPIMSIIDSWTAVWWFGALYAAAMLVLWLAIYQDPEKPIVDADESVPATGDEQTAEAGKGNKAALMISIWIVAFGWACFNIVQNGTINTFYPPYLMGVHGYAQPDAAFVTSVITMLAIPGCILAGWIIDRFKTLKWVMIAGYALIAIAGIWLFSWSAEWQMWLAVFLCGLFAPLATTSAFAAAPDIMGPAKAGFGLAIIAFMQNIGTFAGGLALGNLEVFFGWEIGSYLVFFPLLGIAAICVIFAPRLR
jgi:MFS family permease